MQELPKLRRHKTRDTGLWYDEQIQNNHGSAGCSDMYVQNRPTPEEPAMAARTRFDESQCLQRPKIVPKVRGGLYPNTLVYLSHLLRA